MNIKTNKIEIELSGDEAYKLALGDDALRIDPMIARAACGLACEIVRRFPALENPRLVPIEGGGAQLELQRGGRCLELQLMDTQTICWLTADDPKAETTGECEVNDERTLFRIVAWLLKGD